MNDVLKTPPTREYTRPLIDVKKDIVVLPYSRFDFFFLCLIKAYVVRKLISSNVFSGTTGLPKGVKLTNQNMSSLLHTYTWWVLLIN